MFSSFLKCEEFSCSCTSILNICCLSPISSFNKFNTEPLVLHLNLVYLLVCYSVWFLLSYFVVFFIYYIFINHKQIERTEKKTWQDTQQNWLNWISESYHIILFLSFFWFTNIRPKHRRYKHKLPFVMSILSSMYWAQYTCERTFGSFWNVETSVFNDFMEESS